jgi:hypothetical protein
MDPPMESHNIIEATIELGNNSIIPDFQLVNKQVDIQCDGILGTDFLQSARAKICYETRTVTLKLEKCERAGKAKQLETEGMKRRKIGRVKIAPRTESIVRLPVAPGSPQVGISNKRELQEGVILAGSLKKVVGGYAITIVLNTTEVELEVQEPVVELDEIEYVCDGGCNTESEYQKRERYSDATEIGTFECRRREIVK